MGLLGLELLLFLVFLLEEVFRGPEEVFRGPEEVFRGPEEVFRGPEEVFRGSEEDRCPVVALRLPDEADEDNLPG